MKTKYWVWTAGLAAAGTAAVAWLLGRFLKERGVLPGSAGQASVSTSAGFQKRIFREPDHLRREMDYFLNHPEEIKMVFQGKRVSRPFVGRIMLVVTGVNDCRYCRFAHSRRSRQLGLTQDEVARLLSGDLEQATLAESGALDFALHYSETGQEPEPERVSRLEFEYGADTARDILTVIRIITLFNLCGNTVEALLSRWQGRPAPESTLQSELATVGLILAGAVPYSIAIGLRVAVADTPDSVRPNVLVLQR